MPVSSRPERDAAHVNFHEMITGFAHVFGNEK